MRKLLLAVMVMAGCAASPLPYEDETPDADEAVDAGKPDMGRKPKPPACGTLGQDCCCLANGTQECGCVEGLVCGAGPNGTCG